MAKVIRVVMLKMDHIDDWRRVTIRDIDHIVGVTKLDAMTIALLIECRKEDS
jgi:hypothetical protein